MRSGIYLSILIISAAGLLCFSKKNSAPFSPPRQRIDTVSVPFAHKQSAIIHRMTLEVLDSVVAILNRNPEITLSLEGYAYVDEGNDTICKYLSLNRALFVRECMLGRGIDSSRITSLKAMAQWKPEKRGRYKVNVAMPFRVELLMIYPPPPEIPVVSDIDFDGLPDETDACPDKFGYAENKGCPQKDVLLIHFDPGQSYISPAGFTASDRLVALLTEHPGYTISISGHAALQEGAKSFTDRVSAERAQMISMYLQSRNISPAKIELINSYGAAKPVNAQRDPREIRENACAEITLNKH